MGVTFSSLFADFDDLDSELESYLVRSISKGGGEGTKSVGSLNGGNSKTIEFKSFGSGKLILQGSLSFRGRDLEAKVSLHAPGSDHTMLSRENNAPTTCLPESGYARHEAALKLQKTYKSFRTRRQLADCAVIAEQRWFDHLLIAITILRELCCFWNWVFSFLSVWSCAGGSCWILLSWNGVLCRSLRLRSRKLLYPGGREQEPELQRYEQTTDYYRLLHTAFVVRFQLKLLLLR